ncbi:hypothetical protein QQA45_04780 [Sneathia sanguinegens]|uniref:Uncharacterized protein n=1 Tax=Sneathia sanguinegens TaxID=40543 RepID=A0ABT7HJX7_9FUSO|nr:hypothetical protein [Sneathia sanguinegens]MDK9580829.1 hypothetical protein [Sneathia sanguinegens]
MLKFEVGKKYYDTGRDIQIKIIKRTAKMVTIEPVKGCWWLEDKETQKVKIDQTSAKNTELLRLHKGYFIVSSDQTDVISLEEKQYIDYYNAYYN